jgi:hypothetical protein|tara:strand:+ start:1828 stop:2322 length:495 start_codon:yes stop_codon:yes gene_type:complete
MKVLITESQRQKLLKEAPLLTDILKKAIVKAIESPEVQKIIKKGMENVLEKGAGELKKFTENPRGYVENLKSNIKPNVTLEPEQDIDIPGEYTDEIVDVDVDTEEIVESPTITAKKEEISINKRFLDELQSKKGYKSKRDRDNIDLLTINIGKLERELQALYER